MHTSVKEVHTTGRCIHIRKASTVALLNAAIERLQDFQSSRTSVSKRFPFYVPAKGFRRASAIYVGCHKGTTFFLNFDG